MILTKLFKKFDQFADAPDAVAKMRELVLELAVQGRLVSQNIGDEPTAVMLERILSTAKTRRRDPDVADEFDEPFQIPNSWAWVRLPRILKKLTDGTHHSPPNGPSGDFMYVTAKNIKTDGVLLDGITYVTKLVHEEIYSRCNPSFGDVLYIKDGATTGIATINQVKEPFSMLSSVALLKPSDAIFNRYLLWAMRSPFFYAETRGAMKGAAITRVTLSVMAASLLPLPPLAEQKRIVAKVDELMALCDRLEAQQQERQTRHADLARASLARFAAAPTPANLHFLFHKSYTIPPADLRKSILTLAVQGKLVPQNPNDEAAEELIKKIKSDKEQLIKNGTIKASKDSAPLTEEEKKSPLPKGWKWTRLQEAIDVRDGTHDSPKDSLDSDSYPLITSRNFENGIINFQSARRISAKDHFEIQKRSKVEKYDILFSMIGGNIGNQVLVTTESSFSIKNVALFKYYNRELTYPYFIKVFLEHLAIRLQQEAIGGAQPFVSLGYFRKLPFPLPPIAEQRRIVAKVDQLMALVDELETQLAASRAIARNLLEAVVAELTSIEHVSSANGASHPSLGQGPGLYTHRGAVQGRDAFPKRPGE